MRVDAVTKEKTEIRIRESARNLFFEKGFGATTTRDIASSAGIAVGTLFNYFSTKESLGIALISTELAAGEGDFQENRRGDESLEEELFAFIMAGLRRLDAVRVYAADVLESSLNPLSRPGRCLEADTLRDRHWEVVAGVLTRHGAAQPTAASLMHLYWSLYLGIVGFWSRDASEHQADTLALMDQTTRLFAAAALPRSIKQEVSL